MTDLEQLTLPPEAFMTVFDLDPERGAPWPLPQGAALNGTFDWDNWFADCKPFENPGFFGRLVRRFQK